MKVLNILCIAGVLCWALVVQAQPAVAPPAALPVAPPVAASGAAAATPAPTSLAIATPSPVDALRLLDLWFDAQRVYEKVPGISAGVVIDQTLVWSKGYGLADMQRRVAAAPDTVYSICSISKLFTSIAVMQLWEAGKLSLDDDVAKHLPLFAIRRHDVDSGPMTLRALLSHASGLPREAAWPYWSEINFPTREQLYQRVREQHTATRVAERYQYSNLGMVVLGDVVAAVAGMGYEEYVQRFILGPLAMNDTVPKLPLELLGQRLAVGHGALDREGQRSPLAPYEPRALVAAMGYSSTVNDLAQLARWQLRLLERGGSELLKVATLREMQRVQWQDADGSRTMGLGFLVSRDGPHVIVGHDGLCPGYRTAVFLVPKDKLAVIGMANAIGNTGSAPYVRAMRRLVQKGLRLAPAKDPALLAAYSGRYVVVPWASESVIVPWGEDLAALDLPNTDPSAALQVLKRVKGDTFAAQREDGGPGTEWTFQRDGSGRVTGVSIDGQWTQRSGPLP